MKHGKRLGEAFIAERCPHDRGLNVGSLSGATDAMFVPSLSNPASWQPTEGAQPGSQTDHGNFSDIRRV
jgi:hypothetical protein